LGLAPPVVSVLLPRPAAGARPAQLQAVLAGLFGSPEEVRAVREWEAARAAYTPPPAVLRAAKDGSHYRPVPTAAEVNPAGPGATAAAATMLEEAEGAAAVVVADEEGLFEGCALCAADRQANEVLLPCGHAYCGDCNAQWAAKCRAARRPSSCAACRAPVLAAAQLCPAGRDVASGLARFALVLKPPGAPRPPPLPLSLGLARPM
jgi:hypothetical protein